MACYYAFGVIWRRAEAGRGLPSHDIYAHHYQNFLYARDALERGFGLYWNELQSCGLPFFGIGTHGLGYPPNWLLLTLDPDLALVHFEVDAREGRSLAVGLRQVACDDRGGVGGHRISSQSDPQSIGDFRLRVGKTRPRSVPGSSPEVTGRKGRTSMDSPQKSYQDGRYIDRTSSVSGNGIAPVPSDCQAAA